MLMIYAVIPSGYGNVPCVEFDACYHNDVNPISHPLYQLLQRLEAARIHFTLARYRDDTVLVTMTLVGERVEVDVFEDGHMEVSRFSGSEDVVGGAELVARLIEDNRD